jgi:hypothetical protein
MKEMQRKEQTQEEISVKLGKGEMIINGNSTQTKL